MTPKLKDFIPVYGLVTYFRRVFNSTEEKDWVVVTKMEMYHCFIGLILVVLAASFLIQLFPNLKP